MNALVLDAGALIAIDRDDREVHKTVRDAHRMGVQVLTNSMAVAQVWRDNKGRQAELAKVARVRGAARRTGDGSRQEALRGDLTATLAYQVSANLAC